MEMRVAGKASVIGMAMKESNDVRLGSRAVQSSNCSIRRLRAKNRQCWNASCASD